MFLFKRLWHNLRDYNIFPEILCFQYFQTLELNVWAYGSEMVRILVSRLNGKNQTRWELAEKQAR